jgi:metallophosphoesterase superfamily enzyme
MRQNYDLGFLEKANLPYEFIDAEEMTDMTKEYGIKKAPTLVVVNGDKKENIENVSNIKKYLEGLN